MDKDIEEYTVSAKKNIRYAKNMFLNQKYMLKGKFIEDNSKEMPIDDKVPLNKKLKPALLLRYGHCSSSMMQLKNFIKQASNKNKSNSIGSSRNILNHEPKTPTGNPSHNKNNSNNFSYKTKLSISRHNKLNQSSTHISNNTSNISGFFSNDNKANQAALSYNANANLNPNKTPRPSSSMQSTNTKKRQVILKPQIQLSPSQDDINIASKKVIISTKALKLLYNNLFDKFKRNNVMSNHKANYSTLKKSLSTNQGDINAIRFTDELLKALDHSSSYSILQNKNNELIQNIRHDQSDNDKKMHKLNSNYSVLNESFSKYNAENKGSDQNNDVYWDELKKEYQSNIKEDNLTKMANYVKLKEKLKFIDKIHSDIAYSQHIYILSKLGLDFDNDLTNSYNSIKLLSKGSDIDMGIQRRLNKANGAMSASETFYERYSNSKGISLK